MSFKEIQGDLFNNYPPRCVITHVVNNQNVMSAGFVIPLQKNFPKAKEDYHTYFRDMSKKEKDNILGEVCFSQNDKIIVAHMFAQTLGGKRPLRYDKLVHCMEKVRDYVEPRKLPIVCPRFASHLSGGNWSFVSELIKDIWGDLDVTVYYL